MKNKHKKLNKIKFFPTGSNWKKVLLEIYNNSPHSYGESHKVGFNDNNHPLAKNLKITGYELMLAISFLRDHKLIGDNSKKEPLNHKAINPSWNNSIFLTEKGFDVAVKLENEFNNQKTQNVVVIFTGIMAFTGILAFLRDPLALSKPLFFWSSVAMIFLILFSFYLGNLIQKFRRFLFNRHIKKGGSVAV